MGYKKNSLTSKNRLKIQNERQWRSGRFSSSLVYISALVCVVTIENDEVPDCQHRVPAGQGREESEEPWHYKVERWDSHRLLQRGCWETRKRSFSITGHCVGIHISANFCWCTKSTGNSLFRYFVLILLKNVRLYTNTSNQTGQCSAVILQAIWSHLLVHRPNGYKACIQMDEIMKNDIVCLYTVYNIYGSFLRELQEKFLEKCPWLDWWWCSIFHTHQNSGWVSQGKYV